LREERRRDGGPETGRYLRVTIRGSLGRRLVEGRKCEKVMNHTGGGVDASPLDLEGGLCVRAEGRGRDLKKKNTTREEENQKKKKRGSI